MGGRGEDMYIHLIVNSADETIITLNPYNKWCIQLLNQAHFSKLINFLNVYNTIVCLIDIAYTTEIMPMYYILK